jgi:hypothetical protein
MPKQKLLLPKDVEVSQFVSFQAGERCGTVTRFGVVLGFFNGLTKKEFKCVDKNQFLRIIDKTLSPHSKYPHALILYEDFAESSEDLYEQWLPLSELIFLKEDQVST